MTSLPFLMTPKLFVVERAYSMRCPACIVERTATEVVPWKMACAALYFVFQCCNVLPKKSGTPRRNIFHVEYKRASSRFVKRPTVGEK